MKIQSSKFYFISKVFLNFKRKKNSIFDSPSTREEDASAVHIKLWQMMTYITDSATNAARAAEKINECSSFTILGSRAPEEERAFVRKLVQHEVKKATNDF